MKFMKPCKSCDECTIAEYTDGIGAKGPSKCLTFSAMLGFQYPDQCIIIWIILGIIPCSMIICCIVCFCVNTGVDIGPESTDGADGEQDLTDGANGEGVELALMKFVF